MGFGVLFPFLMQSLGFTGERLEGPKHVEITSSSLNEVHEPFEVELVWLSAVHLTKIVKGSSCVNQVSLPAPFCFL
jgi:hypothetical protein